MADHWAEGLTPAQIGHAIAAGLQDLITAEHRSNPVRTTADVIRRDGFQTGVNAAISAVQAMTGQEA
ncbi:MAG: hypothetical protein LBK42_01985 [Propionibacteriaceae bacterium]|jgi:hypothetical protein|nr:hypothetical protein [Propionibacteriaceae bacterium]